MSGRTQRTSATVQVGQAVVALQRAVPGARVVYCSATGASEPRNLGYMERLGLWGAGNPSYSNFQVCLVSLISTCGKKADMLQIHGVSTQHHPP